MSPLRRAAFAALLILGNAFAADPIADIAKDAADGLATVLKPQKIVRVVVGPMQRPAAFPVAGGAGFMRLLEQALSARGIAVDSTATVGIRTTLNVQEFDATNREVSFVFDVENRWAKSLGRAVRVVDDPAALSAILGLTDSPVEPVVVTTTDLPRIDRPYTNPTFRLDGGTRVKPATGDSLAVEIVVDGQPRPITDRGGFAFVELKEGEVYSVRIYNNDPVERVMRVYIDGLNAMTFCDDKHTSGPQAGEPRYSLFIFNPSSTATVPGWLKTRTQSLPFRVGGFEQSAARRADKRADDGDIGGITVNLHGSYRPGETPPADEPPTAKGPGGLATGFGAATSTPYESLPRRAGALRASVTIRYQQPND